MSKEDKRRPRRTKSDARGFFAIGVLPFIFVFSLFIPGFARAATLYFIPQEQTVGTDTPFQIGMFIDAPDAVNAFDIRVDIPLGVEVVDTDDGDSVINDWITPPTFDETSRILSFSGIVPGGYSAQGGRLLVMSLKADQAGDLPFSYDPSTEIIRNSAVPSQDSIRAIPLILSVEGGKENIANVIPDTDPPEPFTPYLATSSIVFGGRWAVYFGTQDKGSGMFGYQEAESPWRTSDYSSVSWHDAGSPYLLQDQGLSSYVYIKATDKDGNSRVEIVPPEHPRRWPIGAGWLIILLCALFAFLFWRLALR